MPPFAEREELRAAMCEEFLAPSGKGSLISFWRLFAANGTTKSWLRWEWKAGKKPLAQVAKADLNRALIPKFTLGMGSMSAHKEMEFVWGISPISIHCFQAAELKTTSTDPSECCSKGNSHAEVTFFLLSLFFLSCLGLSLMQVGAKPASCLLDVSVSSMAAVRAAKGSNTSNFSVSTKTTEAHSSWKGFQGPWKPWRYLNGARLLDWTAENLSCCKTHWNLKCLFCWLLQTLRSWEPVSWLQATAKQHYPPGCFNKAGCSESHKP